MLSHWAALEEPVPAAGRLSRGSKGADLPPLPRSLRSFLFRPRLSLPQVPAHIQSGVWASLPRRAVSLCRAGQGWLWEARLLAPERKEKRKSISAIAPGPETRRNAEWPIWRPNGDMTLWKAELCKQMPSVFLSRPSSASRHLVPMSGPDMWRVLGKCVWMHTSASVHVGWCET